MKVRHDIFRILSRFNAVAVTVVCLLAAQSALGQFYFGRNKVIYNHFEWHVLQTEHFDIYFYPQMRALAEIGASYAEESYLVLEAKFNHNVSQRIPLIFYATHSHFQETNTLPYLIPEGVGGFFEFLKGRVVVPADGSVSDFKHVLRHELVHVFTYAKIQRIMKDHRILNHPGLPLWFTEGIAEYWSSGWDTQAEMVIRDAVINDYLFPLERIYEIEGSFLMYKEGQAVMKYIAETYGEDKILQLMENIWMSNQFSEIIKYTFGIDLKEFDQRWIYALKKDKYPLLADYDAAGRVSDKITRKGFNIKPAYYQQADSQQIVFISNRTGYSNIYLAPLLDEDDNPEAEILVAGERTSDFESLHLLNSNLDVNANGELVFVAKSGEKDVLYIYNIKKRAVVEQHLFDDLVSMYSPQWSPDGRHITFAGLAFSGRRDIYIFHRQSKQLLRLMDDAYDDRDPSFSPDGRWLAFSSDRGAFGKDGYYNLFLYDCIDNRIFYLTHGAFSDQMPKWSFDGEYIAFVSDRDGINNIWVLQTNGTMALQPLPQPSDSSQFSYLSSSYFATALSEHYPLRQVTFFITGVSDPEWTNEGDLLFSAFENFSFNIHRFNDFTEEIKIAPVAENDTLDHTHSSWAFKTIDGKGSTKQFKYRPKFSLDIAQSQITQDPIFGTSGGAQLVVSDMLGNYQYYFLLYNNARTRDEFLSSFNVAVSRVDLSRRTNIAVGAYHFAGRYYNRYDYWFWERRYGGYTALSYPLSKFTRVEASLNVRHSDKEWYYTSYRRKAMLVSNFFSFVRDNSLWGPTGPLDGTRINITLGNTLDIAHARVNFATVIFDYRRYFRLSNPVAHAVRLWTQINEGKEATPFFMGGSWDLRGYRLWRLWGTKLALVSNELRFPFIDRFSLKFPFGGLAFSSIRGAVFLDVGNAWDDELENMLGSMGFGIRFRFGGMLVLRFDVGRKFELTDLNHFYDYQKYDVDDKWFTQFFFGWDF
ncbi:PD40 domain-containing protein [candidate division KSB1 bacterium]|nr:PD40 domain-containing protein [candidate division KSB1 bacterium]